MTGVITCDAIIEPFSFKDVGDAIGVQLNFELREEIADPESHFRSFLEALPATRFFLYKHIGSKLNSPVELQPLEAAPHCHAEAIQQWLAAADLPWYNEVPKVDEGTTSAQLGVGQLLAGAQTWPAPLPQNAALNRLLVAPAQIAEGNLYVVAIPWLAKDGNPPPELIVEEELKDFASLHVSVPAAPDRPKLQVNLLQSKGNVDGVTNGFLEIEKFNDDVLALVDSLRRKAAGQFWTAPQLIALSPAVPEAPNNTSTVLDQRHEALVRLRIRASHSTVTLLDTLLLALTMPWKSLPGSVHFVLGPILQCVLAAAEEIAAEGDIGDDYRVELKKYPDDVRKWVSRLQDDWKHYLEVLPTLLERASFADELKGVDWSDPAKRQSEGKSILAWLLLSPKPDIDPGVNFDFVAADAQLDQELAELVQLLGEEQGFEAAILQFLRTARTPEAEGAKLLLDSLFVPSGAPPAEGKAKSDPNTFPPKLIARISNYFASHYNALEAARQAVGRVAANAYLDAVRVMQAKEPPETPPSLDNNNWFVERTNKRPPKGRDMLFDRLLLMLPYYGEPLPSADAELLQLAWVESCADLGVTGPGHERRFIPATHPADLPFLLPLPPQQQEDDQFEPLYDGIGLLVRRTSGEKSSNWSQASRVNLTCADGEVTTSAIMPSQPAFEDGERSLFFEYRGHYLAFDTLPDPDGDGDGVEPYYRPLPPDIDDSFKNPPPLAYGTKYEVAAFAISRNGVIPAEVAAGAGPSERRKASGDLSGLTGIPTKSAPYSRQTGIGRAVLRRSQNNAVALKLDKNSVLPLAFDYPRTGLASLQTGSNWLDLWRREDGSGSIALPQADIEVLTLRLNGLATSDGLRVSVALVTSVASDFEDINFTEIPDAGISDSIELKIDRKDGKIRLNEEEFGNVDADERGWIRLKLETDIPEAAISFVDPTGDLEGNSRGDERDSKDFLLLRPQTGDWREEFPSFADFDLLPPSMSPTDLDRWLANPRLYKEASADDDKERLRKLQTLLLSMAFDEGEDAAELFRKYSGFLPDLAAHQLQAELVILDAIGDGSHGRAVVKHETIKLPDLPSLIKQAGEVPLDENGFIKRADDPQFNQMSLLEAFLKKLFEQRTIKVTVGSGDMDLEFDKQRTLKVSVPPGKVAQLRLKVAVASSHYKDAADGSPPVIDPRFRQFATGSYSEDKTVYLLFDGPAMRIEVMGLPDKDVNRALHSLAETKLVANSAPGSRAYTLQCDPAGDPVWQWCGRADVSSQRWRHLGRPQTRWFNPSTHPSADSSDHESDGDEGKKGPLERAMGPVLEIEKSRTGLSGFEEEAFDGRESDAQLQTVRLSPIGEPSILHEGGWELPSATMFRHRVTLQNRYAPAMRQKDGREWPVVAATTEKDWVRVVVLADRNRIRLTRPQLRVIMPLPLSERPGTCPPLLTMLAEPPFADGGLADRVAAGVATGIGYEMKKTDAGERLGVDDTRQEFGPDPQDTYMPLPNELNGAISLNSVGPIGMTFDRDANTSAAFVNSAWLLTPNALIDDQDQDFQEHFASISLQRYLDPNWITQPILERDGDQKDDKVVKKSQPRPFSQAQWFDVKDSNSTLQCGEQDIISIAKTGGRWIVKTNPRNILPEAPKNNANPVVLAKFAAGSNRHCALLHQPLDDKRAALSIFAVEPGREPNLMASFQWIAGNYKPEVEQSSAERSRIIKLRTDDNDDLVDGRLTSASLVTDMEWARTGRDLELIAAIRAGEQDKVEKLGIGKVSVDAGTFVDRDGQTLWLRPSLHDTKVPLHKQRFLATLPTYQAGGPGRPMQIYDPENPVRPLLIPQLGIAMDRAGAKAHLLEIECPARPIGSDTITGIPPEYERPRFDLRECGIEEDYGCLLAMIRPTGIRSDLGGETLSLSISGDGSPIIVKFPGEQVDMIVLAIDREGNGHRAWQIDKSGAETSLTIQSATKISGHTVTFAVKCKKEWWGSVALLSATDIPARLADLKVDFDWMFGPMLASAQGELEASLTHKALRETKAAQARILSISNPIEVGST